MDHSSFPPTGEAAGPDPDEPPESLLPWWARPDPAETAASPLNPPGAPLPPLPAESSDDAGYRPKYVRPAAEPLLPPPPRLRPPRHDPPEPDRHYPAPVIGDTEPVPAPEPARRARPWRAALLAVASGVIGAGLALIGFVALDDDPAPAPAVAPAVEQVRTEIVDSSAEGSAAVIRAVGRAVIPSIVTVEIDSDGGEFLADSSGSGVVLDGAGHIVTNEHVISGGDDVRVVFSDRRTYPASVVGTDALTDLAVLRITATGLTPATIGSTTDLAIGDAAIAVGSPLGLRGGPSLTAGVISAFQRQVRTGPNNQDTLYGMIQTDAPITRGSSGGALVDNQGRLIGITSAIGVSNVGAEGIGFAIPIELVQRVTDEIIATGEARHAFLGIEGETDFAEDEDGARVPVGVVVVNVLPDSSAAAAGIEVGDRIRALDGDPVVAMENLITTLRGYRVGSMAELSIERAGEAVDVDLELGERPPGS